EGAAHSGALGLRLVQPLPVAVVGRDGAYRWHAFDSAIARLRQFATLVSWRRPEPVQADARRRSRIAAPGVSLCRPGLLRKESRGVFEARPAGLQTRLWRRPLARAHAARVSERSLAWCRSSRRAGEGLQRR